MANIASGYLSIEIKEKQAADELADAIKDSLLFSYGGKADIQIGGGELGVGFSCRWTGDGCWDWLDQQLSDSSTLSHTCKEALRNAEVYEYTYEYGCQHRDRVHKPAGESRLIREQANIPFDIVTALKIADAFSLSPGEVKMVSGGTVTLTSRDQPQGDKGQCVYSFSIICGYAMQLTVDITSSTLSDEHTEYRVVDIELDDWDPENDEEDYDETSMFKEIVDDIVADCDSIYVKLPPA